MDEDSWDQPGKDFLDRDGEAAWRRESPPPAVLDDLMRSYHAGRVPSAVRMLDAMAPVDPYGWLPLRHAALGGDPGHPDETLALLGGEHSLPGGPGQVYFAVPQSHPMFANALIEALPDARDRRWLPGAALWSASLTDETASALQQLIEEQGIRASDGLQSRLSGESPPFGMR